MWTTGYDSSLKRKKKQITGFNSASATLYGSIRLCHGEVMDSTSCGLQAMADFSRLNWTSHWPGSRRLAPSIIKLNYMNHSVLEREDKSCLEMHLWQHISLHSHQILLLGDTCRSVKIVSGVFFCSSSPEITDAPDNSRLRGTRAQLPRPVSSSREGAFAPPSSTPQQSLWQAGPLLNKQHQSRH